MGPKGIKCYVHKRSGQMAWILDTCTPNKSFLCDLCKSAILNFAHVLGFELIQSDT